MAALILGKGMREERDDMCEQPRGEGGGERNKGGGRGKDIKKERRGERRWREVSQNKNK